MANSLALSYNRVVLIRIEGLSPGDAMYLDLLACDVARERAPVRIYIPEAFCEPVICIRQWLVAVKPQLHDDKKPRRKPRVSLAFFFIISRH